MLIDPALHQLINEFGQTMRLSDLKLDNDGGCAVRLDKKLVVNLQCREVERELWFYVDMGTPATGSKIYADLLRGNLFWSATFGATLSLSGDTPPTHHHYSAYHLVRNGWIHFIKAVRNLC